MPRQPRLNVPGGLFHIIARGIERRRIFLDKSDYADFLDRLSIGLEKSKCRCYAWALMPNHFHLLIQAGSMGTTPLMRRLLTGYAGHFNRRYTRSGHLFQNRYKSILCDKDTYFLELVRYIHLNPVRAKLVSTIDQLKSYPWTGHGTLLGEKPRVSQETDEVLNLFGPPLNKAGMRYLEYMKEGAGQGHRPELVGGGLLRSMGRNPGECRGAKRKEKMAFDDRILGSGHFVEKILKAVEKENNPRFTLTVEEIAQRLSHSTGVNLENLLSKGRREEVSRAKAILIYLGTRYARKSGQSMGEMTGMSAQAASKAKDRGKLFWESDASLRKLIN